MKRANYNFLKLRHTPLMMLAVLVMSLFCAETITAQEKNQVVRLARIVIDPAQIESYKAALKEGIESAVRLEPGVLSLNAVYEKDNPTHVTVLEVYADANAYNAHLKTAHFKKYKTITKDMVVSLELADVVPIAMKSQPKF
ncbi:MAG: putative quinol monooxygenase [Ferruginibacter sp.]